MASIDKQRRHDERWQAEVLVGMARMLDVLHDISDGLRDLGAKVERLEREQPVGAQPPHPTLLSVEGLAELLGVSVGTVRSLRFGGSGPTVTKIGRKVMFRRSDVETWLAAQREPEPETTRPWRGSYLPGRIGAGLSSSTEDPPCCNGSYTEPKAASRYSGRGVCRVCGDDVLVMKAGTLRRHRPRWGY